MLRTETSQDAETLFFKWQQLLWRFDLRPALRRKETNKTETRWLINPETYDFQPSPAVQCKVVEHAATYSQKAWLYRAVANGGACFAYSYFEVHLPQHFSTCHDIFILNIDSMKEYFRVSDLPAITGLCKDLEYRFYVHISFSDVIQYTR